MLLNVVFYRLNFNLYEVVRSHLRRIASTYGAVFNLGVAVHKSSTGIFPSIHVNSESCINLFGQSEELKPQSANSPIILYKSSISAFPFFFKTRSICSSNPSGLSGACPSTRRNHL